MPARDPFSPSDQPRLLAHLPSLAPRDRTLLLAGFDTGFRARELGHLTVGHVIDAQESIKARVTLERRSLKFGRGERRTSVRSRTVPLTPRLQVALRDYLESRFTGRAMVPDEPLFLSRKQTGLSPSQINRLVQRIALDTGCDPDRTYGSHSLRKTFAHKIYTASHHDLNATRAALGHASVMTTIRYLEVDRDHVDALILGASAA